MPTTRTDVPPSVEARTVSCLNFAGAQRTQQVAHRDDPGNRFSQFSFNHEDGPSTSKVIRQRPDGDGGEESYYAPGPDDAQMRGGAAKPSNCYYVYTAWEAAGNGYAIIFGTKSTPPDGRRWYSMQQSHMSDGSVVDYEWVLADPQPASDEEWAQAAPFRGEML